MRILGSLQHPVWSRPSHPISEGIPLDFSFGTREGRDLFCHNLTADQVYNFISARQTPCLLLRIDLFAINENIQCSRGASTQPNRNPEFPFEMVFETHGLGFEVTSKEAASDLDSHIHRTPALTRLWYEYTDCYGVRGNFLAILNCCLLRSGRLAAE